MVGGGRERDLGACPLTKPKPKSDLRDARDACDVGVPCIVRVIPHEGHIRIYRVVPARVVACGGWVTVGGLSWVG